MILIEYPESVFVKGLRNGLPVIRRYVITGDGFMKLSEEYPKEYPKKQDD